MCATVTRIQKIRGWSEMIKWGLSILKATLVICLLFFAGNPALYADINDVLADADRLDKEGDYEAEKSLLLSSLSQATTSYQIADLNWRLSRATLMIGDTKKRAGAQPPVVVPIFEEGESYADVSIANNQKIPDGYFWKAANIGLWGQARGIFESLAKAAPMRDLLHQAVQIQDDHADSYNVLGQLYEQVPGWPFSFGNPDYAVSLGRRPCTSTKRS